MLTEETSTIMKKSIILLLFIISVSSVNGQYVAVANKFFALENNHLFNVPWESMGTIIYTDYNIKDNSGYGLAIAINRPHDYINIMDVAKVSIEYIDDTKEIVDVKMVSQYTYTVDIDNKQTEVYRRVVTVFPNCENLVNKQLRRIVLQCSNGDVWIINTSSRRSKKLKKEIKRAMDEAFFSYIAKKQNDNYFKQ